MIKHTVKLVLRQKENSEGLLPIYLRITVNRKSSFLSTGYFVPEGDWDKRNESVKPHHPLHEEINRDILDKKRSALSNLVNASVQKQSVSAKAIRNQVSDKVGHNDIYAFAESYKKSLAGKRSPGTFTIWEKHLEKLREYGGQVTFEQVTPDFLTGFEAHLRGAGVKRRKIDGSNYIHVIMRTIRRFFLAAIKKGIISYNPFSDYEIPAYTPDDKEYLEIKEMDMLHKYLKAEKRKERRQGALYFLFGCYTGLRISDWFLFDIKKKVKGDYITLRAKKNGGTVAMPIHRRLREVLEGIQKEPLTIHEKKFYGVLQNIVKDLKWDKHLSPHCSRKSFAVTMCLDQGISSETAAELMGITLPVFVSSYSKVTPHKILSETTRAWAKL